MTELNDQTLLIHWYRNRNAQAFRVLATRHAPMVYATALRVLRNPHDAEEVSQESFLALAQTRRPPSGSVAAWLHRTAYRAALGLIRTRDRRNSRDQRFADAQPVSTGTAWDDIRELVDEAVAALPERHREPIVRYFFEAQTHEDIARALGVSRQTVTYRIGQAIDRVRKELARKGVVAPVGAALAALVHENASAAVPVETLAELGRIALVAKPSMWAAIQVSAAGPAMKGVAVILVFGMAGWAVLHYMGIRREDLPAGMVRESDVVSEKALGAPGPSSAEYTALALDRPESGAEHGADSGAPAAGVSAAGASLAPAVADAGGVGDRGTIAGVVMLPDKRPFAGANIYIVNTAHMGAARYPDGTYFHMNTDTSGRFEQSGLRQGEYSIMLKEPTSNSWGQSSEFARIELAAGEIRSDLKFVFGGEGDLTISGTVVDGAGRPVADVEVTSWGSVSRGDVTNTQGRFTLHYLPDEEFRLSADKRGYSGPGSTVQAGDQNVQMVLNGDGAIAGRAIDASTRKPVPQFEASFMNGHSPTIRESLFNNGKAFDNPDGKFEFPQVYVGDVTVVARAPGYAPTLAHVIVEPGRTLEDVTLVLDPAAAAALKGTVLTESGVPVAGANIYMDRIAPPDSRDRNVVAVTDKAGEFTVDDAPPDTPFLAAWHPDFAPGSAPVSEDTTIVLKRSGRLNVEVVSLGQPMHRIEVRAYFMNNPNVGYIGGGITGLDGWASVEEVIPGPVMVQILLASSRTQHKQMDFAPGEERTVRFDVSPGEANVEGTVYDGGAPVTAGEVSLYVETEAGRDLFKQRIGADGAFQFRGAPSGTAQLAAITDNSGRRTRVDDIPLEAGQTTTLAVDVKPTRTVAGSLRGLHVGDMAMVYVFYGQLTHAEALDAAAETWFSSEYAGIAPMGESGNYEMPLHSSGAYTLLVATCQANDFSNITYRESQVVEVNADEDLIADLELDY